MALDDPEYVKELFSSFGPVSVRRMFGGTGIFADGLMFGLVADGELYLKADESTIPAFQTEGVGPFEYGARNRRVVMTYWRAPDRLLDDLDELALWARKALSVAQRAAEAKPLRTRPQNNKRKKKSARRR